MNMRTLGLLVALLLMSTLPAHAQWWKLPVVLQAPHEDEVRIERDLVYKMGGDKPLRMDVYRPLDAVDPLPAVVFVHGGPVGTLPIDVKNAAPYESWGRLAAGHGMAGVTFTHSFAAVEEMGNASQDIIDAVRFLRDNAVGLGVDPSRVCIWAISGAGSLIGPLLKANPDYLKCWVLYYPYMDPTGIVRVLGGEVSDSTLQELRPHQHLKPAAGLPPTFVVRAGRDREDFNAVLDQFIADAISTNQAIRVVNYPEGDHGFDQTNDTDESRRIILETFAFLRQELGVHSDGEGQRQ